MFQRLKVLLITNTTHYLNLPPATKSTLFARGHLVGSFEDGKPVPDEKIDFVANFEGFFQLCNQQYLFHGRIDAFQQNKEAESFESSTFRGCFRGVIMNNQVPLNLGDLSKETGDTGGERLEVWKNGEYIVPVFARFLLKKVSKIHLKQAVAYLDGDLLIEIHFLPEMIRLMKMKRNKYARLSVGLSRENSIELPLRRGSVSGDGYDAECKVKMEHPNILNWTIRKECQAQIDSSYGAFFAPFGLLYLRLVITFYNLTLVGENGEFVRINFVLADLDDQLPKVPFTPYSHLLDNLLKLRARHTKISLLRHADAGEFLIATNHIQMYPHYYRTLVNSNNLHDDLYWRFGLISRNKILKPLPQPLSLEEEWDKKREIKQLQPRWCYMHIEVPIYRAAGVTLVQVFFPLIILSALGMMVFSQENGIRSDGNTALAARILNVATITLAFMSLVPLLRQNTAPAPILNLTEIVICLSVVPPFLALVSSLNDHDISNQEWLATYNILQDPFFLISFALLVFLLLILIFVLIFLRTNYQIRYNLRSLPYLPYSEAKFPDDFVSYYTKLTKYKRPNQYQITQEEGEQPIHRKGGLLGAAPSEDKPQNLHGLFSNRRLISVQE